MEKDRFVPSELTSGGENSYSNSDRNNMTEPVNNEPVKATPDQLPEELKDKKIEELREILKQKDLPMDLRGAITSMLQGLLSIPGNEAPIITPPTPGLPEPTIASDNPDSLQAEFDNPSTNPNFTPQEQEARNAANKDRVEDLARRRDEARREKEAKGEEWTEEDEAKFRPARNPWEKSSVEWASERAGRLITKEDIEKARRDFAEHQKADEVYDWLIDPIKREEYFNSIYALVDSKPHEFWNQAFDALTDGSKEHYFNETLLKAQQGKWADIALYERGPSAGINAKLFKQKLALYYGLHESQITDDAFYKITAALKEDISRDIIRFQRQRHVRKTLHDANAILYLPTVKADQLFDSMQQFDTASGDLAFATPGVRLMTDLYEEALREVARENNGYLDPQDVTISTGTEAEMMTVRGKDGVEKKVPIVREKIAMGEAERRAKERFMEMAKRGLIKGRVKAISKRGGKDESERFEEYELGSDQIRDWDLDKIFVMARGMMIMDQRLLSLAAESELPKGTIRYASGFLQDVMQGYSGFSHALAKWGLTEEALAALLFENKEKKGFARIFDGWDPKELEKAYQRYKDDPTMLYESLDRVYYLGKRNPNRAGDVFTWISWRGQNTSEEVSMFQDFLAKGERNMVRRWREKHPGETEVPDDFRKEYENWTGTAFRLEKLRPKLDLYRSPVDGDQDEFREAFKKAKPIIGQMVNLQPHRMFSVSKFVRDRVYKQMYLTPKEREDYQKEERSSGRPKFYQPTNEQQRQISIDLKNLAYVEAAMLNDREALLDEGIRFADITPEMIEERYYERVIPDAAERERAMKLARAVRKDYKNETDKKDKDNNYYKEFVYNREYTHGYVLWTGDIPKEELNFSSLGATGGFARRARDNQNQAKAGDAEVEVLNSLKKIHDPDQLQEALVEIFKHIDHYDRHKGKQAIAEKAEGYIKFFKAGWESKIPGYRMLAGGKLSYARMVYGVHAPVWESSDIHGFIEKLHHAGLIDHAGHERLKKAAGATYGPIAGELAGIFGMFLVYAIYGAGSDALKEALDDIEG